jgi:hypothetical protein
MGTMQDDSLFGTFWIACTSNDTRTYPELVASRSGLISLIVSSKHTRRLIHASLTRPSHYLRMFLPQDAYTPKRRQIAMRGFSLLLARTYIHTYTRREESSSPWRIQHYGIPAAPSMDISLVFLYYTFHNLAHTPTQIPHASHHIDGLRPLSLAVIMTTQACFSSHEEPYPVASALKLEKVYKT